MSSRTATNALVSVLLRLMAWNYRFRPALRRYLRSRDGWMDFTVGVRTLDGSAEMSIRFFGGKVRVRRGIPKDADTVLQFRNGSVVRKMLDLSPAEVMNLLLKNELSISGNLAVMSKFNYLLSVLLEKKHRKMTLAKRAAEEAAKKADESPADREGAKKLSDRKLHLLSAKRCDAVEFLDDPYLSNYSLKDFPRLRAFLDIHFHTKPEVSDERARLLTEWCRANGFETDSKGTPWRPVERQAKILGHILAGKKPIIRTDDLLAGTTTDKEIGVVLYPETHGTMIWGELKSVPERTLNPYNISDETREILHHDVFPYWEKRNVREVVRREQGEPLCQKLDERFAVYFLWKTVAVSHTIPDFPKLLSLGTVGMIREIEEEIAASGGADETAQRRAMIAVLEAMEIYAANLARKAEEDAEACPDPTRKIELEEIAGACRRVPSHAARTLHEAVQSVWITWVALHMENTNAGLSLGRLDQWFQPYFRADMERIRDAAGRAEYVKKAVELIGCFYMRCTDHLPLVPDIGNFLFGGSSSDQAITLGGVTPSGDNGVNDMTFVFLKVTEMLNIRDPNVNARYEPHVNSDDYLSRLVEVNLSTSATPSMHNDAAVRASLAEFGYPDEHLRDWSATGCVEPTLSGRHMGHTNCMMMNMVAALEMALYNGRHPLMNWDFGPRTGEIGAGAFSTFDEFFTAFETQYGFLIDRACEYNNLLGLAHQKIRPTPLLSSFIDGCRQSGKDASQGGALYNSSGAACIGLADVTDSLLAVKRLVYDEKAVTFADLKRAVAGNFANDPKLHARILYRVPKFGSGDEEALALAKRVAKFTHDRFGANANYRGGRYTAGFWSMSNHVAFGCLTGALPSGRAAGKPFTPGLTPAPLASDHLLDPIRDVARLPAEHMNNNIAFNVKVVPGVHDTHERTVKNIFSYVKTYFGLGGMQMQLNIVTSAILRDAMKNPENYPNLLVRISGYNAYFVTLNRDMQLELIERAEYGVGGDKRSA